MKKHNIFNLHDMCNVYVWGREGERERENSKRVKTNKCFTITSHHIKVWSVAHAHIKQKCPFQSLNFRISVNESVF